MTGACTRSNDLGRVASAVGRAPWVNRLRGLRYMALCSAASGQEPGQVGKPCDVFTLSEDPEAIDVRKAGS